MSYHLGLTDVELVELSNLYHSARLMLAGRVRDPSVYQRRCWAAERFHEQHPEHATTKAYKALERMAAGEPLPPEVAERLQRLNDAADG